MEPESPSPYPQVSATYPYPEPTASTPHDPDTNAVTEHTCMSEENGCMFRLWVMRCPGYLIWIEKKVALINTHNGVLELNVWYLLIKTMNSFKIKYAYIDI
jgi:hypothetical protein